MMWKIKASLLLILLMGCHSHKLEKKGDKVLPDLPRHFLIPTSPPKYNVQINPIPHPFNLGGNHPYAVWVNGKRLPLSGQETRALAQSLNLQFRQPKNTAEIHNGEGWQYPLDLKRTEKPQTLQSFFQEEVFIDVE